MTQKDQKKILVSKKCPQKPIPSSTIARTTFPTIAQQSLIANSDANTNASVSGLLLHIH